MNILINGKCSKSCSFCFQDKDFKAREDMSLDTFKDIIRWMVHSYQNDSEMAISLLGGEPTIHPQFQEMLDYLLEVESYINNRLRVAIITNGELLDNYLPTIAKFQDAQLLLNASSFYNKQEDLVKIITETTKYPTIMVNLSYTITIKSIKEELEHILNTIDLKGIYSIRLSSGSFPYINILDYYKINKKYLFEAYEMVAKKDVLIGMDCSKIPKCIYTEDELFNLLTLPIMMNGDNFAGASCTYNADILPNGDVVHCMPLIDETKDKLKFYEFNNAAEVYNYTQDIAANKLQLKMIDAEKCKDCIEYKTRRCFGGCLGMEAIK